MLASSLVKTKMNISYITSANYDLLYCIMNEEFGLVIYWPLIVVFLIFLVKWILVHGRVYVCVLCM